MDSKPPAPAPAAIPSPAPAPNPSSASLPLPDAPRRRGAGGGKRKSTAFPSSSASPPPKRQAKDRHHHHHPVVPLFHNGPTTRARQSPHKHAAIVAQRSPDLAAPAPEGADRVGDVGGFGGGEVVKVDEEEEMIVEEEPVVDLEFEAIRSRAESVHAVPTHAGWFSWKEIHPIEKHMLPSFFNGKFEQRTPVTYLEIRNSIMKKFHADPQTQVELSFLSELPGNDMDAKQEVMEFLDHWGLINFHPFPPSQPEPTKPDANDGIKITSVLEKLYLFENIQCFPHRAPKKEVSSATNASPSFLAEPSIADELVKPVGPSVDYHCNSCSGDCSRKRYHCQKQADYDLCTDCYTAGKFDSDMNPSDFILMEFAEVPGASGGSWTDQETLLLLEALELFGENWSEIAEHVATKTKAQCILHFLQMPIEDSFLDGEDDAAVNDQDNLEPNLPSKELTTSSPPDEGKPEKEGTEDEAQAKDNAPETTTTVVTESSDKPASPKIDDAVNKDAPDGKDSDEAGVTFALDALKAAFHAVGYFPEQEGLGSFADAGNPVMALAVFLANLVDSDVLNTSCRSSLKAISEDSPEIQLATRHCFLLEDPPDDKIGSPLPSVVTDTCNVESCKDEEKSLALHDSENSKDCIDDKDNKEKDADNDEEKDAASVKRSEDSCLAAQDGSPKHVDANKSTDSSLVPLEATESTDDTVDKPSSREQSEPSKPKDATDSALNVVSKASIEKDIEELPSQEPVQTNEIPKDNSNATVEKPNVAVDSVDSTPKENAQQTVSTGVQEETMDASIVLPESQRCEQVTGVTSMDENKEKAEEQKKEESVEKNGDSVETCHDNNLSRLRRAAVTTLSAAAVKAKLLANQEEDEVRQLVALIIDKQLQKLDTKLSLFSDVESIVTRVREQTERARQRLLQERSQIIAARLGVSASTLRANATSLPTSRMAMGYGTTGLKPPNMGSQRPPVLRKP